MAAKTPLHSDQLLPLVGINIEQYVQAENREDHDFTTRTRDNMLHPYIMPNITAEMLLKLCGYLLMLDDSKSQWKFMHAFVGKYFESRHFTQLQA